VVSTSVWTFSRVECLECGHTWIGVHPLNAPNLECPECGDMDTVRENTVEEDPDE
jgi:ribosomal protein S27E